jgi:hypothetical protein
MSGVHAELGGVIAAPPAPAKLDAGEALYLCLVMQGLKRVVTNAPAHRAFIRATCHLHPEKLSEAQRDHLRRLAWRYRFYLRPSLRPSCDPDLNPKPEEN